MSNNAYGVVVKEYSTHVGIWQLFSNPAVRLTGLDRAECEYALHQGDIVTSRTEGDETRVRKWWPFSESVWSDGRRVVVRTIVSCDGTTTLDRGKWKEEGTDLSYVLLMSRDIGLVVAPLQWYNTVVFDSSITHLYLYAEFIEQQLTNTTNEKCVEYHWAVIEDRAALPATPSPDEDPGNFLLPLELRKVPVITLFRQGSSMIVWSYTLGDHSAIIEVDEKSAIGQWMLVTVRPSSASDFKSHGCKYTVIKRHSVGPYSFPEAKVAKKSIEMVVTLNRSEPDPANPRAPMTVWHDQWGLPVLYSEGLAAWIRRESPLRAVIEVATGSYAGSGLDGRRVTVKIVCPSGAPMKAIDPAPPSPSTTPSPPFRDVHEMKNALRAADNWENLQIDNDKNNNNNNYSSNNNADQWYNWEKKKEDPPTVPTPKMNDDGWYNWQKKKDPTTKTTQRSDGNLKAAEKPNETKAHDPWLDIPKMTMRQSASTTPQQTAPKKKETVDPFNWRNYGKDKDGTVEPVFTGVWGQDIRTATDDDSSGFGRIRRKTESTEKRSDGVQKGTVTGFGTVPQHSEKKESTKKPNDEVQKGAFSGFGTVSQYSDNAESTERRSDGVKRGSDRGPTTKAKASTKEGYESTMVNPPVPIRAYDDELKEMAWRKEMQMEGWKWPHEPQTIVIPDGDDGWEQMGSKTFGKHNNTAHSPMPVEALISRRNFLNQVMRIKRLRCLITKVRYCNENWKTVIRIQLFVLEGEGWGTFVTHRLDDPVRPNQVSYLQGRPEFTTVGNVVDLHIGRHENGWYVNDEMWRYCEKVKLPWRVTTEEQSRVKSIELIVNAKCLEPEQDEYNRRRHRVEQTRTVKLIDQTVNEILYMGEAIDPRERDDYTFVVVVVPEVEGHAFWRATEVHWRVQMEALLDPFARPQWVEQPRQQPVTFPHLKAKPPTHVEFKSTKFEHTLGVPLSDPKKEQPKSYCVMVSRETRLNRILSFYKDLLKREDLLRVLYDRFGIDYETKLLEAIEVAESAVPHQKSLKKELQVNADFLCMMIDNPFMEAIFKANRARKLWKELWEIADNVKAFRCSVNNLA